MNIGLKCFATLAEADKCDYKNSTPKALPDGSTIRKLLSKEAIPEKDVKLISSTGSRPLWTRCCITETKSACPQQSAACEIHSY